MLLSRDAERGFGGSIFKFGNKRVRERDYNSTSQRSPGTMYIRQVRQVGMIEIIAMMHDESMAKMLNFRFQVVAITE